MRTAAHRQRATARERRPLAYLVKEAHQGFRDAFDDALGPIGLSLAQLGVLSRVAQSPGLSGAELARDGFMTAQSMSELVAGLERRGLLRRRQGAAGGRSLAFSPTTEGLRSLRTGHDAIVATEALVLSELSRAQVSALRGLLERSIASMRTVREARKVRVTPG